MTPITSAQPLHAHDATRGPLTTRPSIVAASNAVAPWTPSSQLPRIRPPRGPQDTAAGARGAKARQLQAASSAVRAFYAGTISDKAALDVLVSEVTRCRNDARLATACFDTLRNTRVARNQRPLQPSLPLVNALLWSHAQSGDLQGLVGQFDAIRRHGKQWVAPGQPQGLRPDINSYCALLSGFARAGDPAGASRWFETLCQEADRLSALGQGDRLKIDLRAYETVISAHAAAGDHRGAAHWFEHLTRRRAELGLNPTTHTFRLLICAHRGDPKGAARWFETMMAHELRPTLDVFEALISAHEPAGDVAGANAWFAHMKRTRATHGVSAQPSTWLALMKVQAAGGDPRGAERSLAALASFGPGVVANGVAHGLRVAAYDKAGNPMAARGALNAGIHAGAIRRSKGYSRDNDLLNLLRSEVLCHVANEPDEELHPAVAKTIFEELAGTGNEATDAAIVTRNTTFRFLEGGTTGSTLEGLMRQRGWEPMHPYINGKQDLSRWVVRPDAPLSQPVDASFRGYLDGTKPFSTFQDMGKHYDSLIASHWQAGDRHGTAEWARDVIDARSRLFLDGSSKRRLDHAEKLSRMTWMLQAHARHGDTEGAAKWLSAMLEEKVEPTTGTYRILMSGHAAKGDAQGALDCLGDLLSRGLRPDVTIYGHALAAAKQEGWPPARLFGILDNGVGHGVFQTTTTAYRPAKHVDLRMASMVNPGRRAGGHLPAVVLETRIRDLADRGVIDEHTRIEHDPHLHKTVADCRALLGWRETGATADALRRR